MNNNRRKRLEHIKERIESLMSELTCDLKEELELILSEEQDCYDNMPESLQNGERGEASQQAIDGIQQAIDELEMLDVETITSNIETAIE